MAIPPRKTSQKNMSPRNDSKRKREGLDESLEQAASAVASGMSMRKASKEHGVSFNMLHREVNGQRIDMKKAGRKPRLTERKRRPL